MEIVLLIIRILLIVLLYSFLGLIVILLWRDVRSAERREAASTTPALAARLVVLEGIDGLDSGTAYTLKAYTSLGRADSNTIELPDTYCSAEHALVVWRNKRWWLEDRDSRNGTLLNGQAVETPTVIGSGDEIRFGRINLRFEAIDEV